MAIPLAVNIFSGSVVSYAASDTASESTVSKDYSSICAVEDLYGINNDLEDSYILMDEVVANKAAAKTTVSYPKRVTVTANNYYKYWDAHRSALEKAGYIEGDGQDAFVAWSKVSGADGYGTKRENLPRRLSM